MQPSVLTCLSLSVRLERCPGLTEQYDRGLYYGTGSLATVNSVLCDAIEHRDFSFSPVSRRPAQHRQIAR